MKNDAAYRLLPLGSLTGAEAFGDRNDLGGLARSLCTLGPLEPILVSPPEGGVYPVIAGRRRVQAARQAGIDTLPARVLEGVDAELVRAAENVARRDLAPAPFVEAIGELVTSRGSARVADALGLTVAKIENLRRLRSALDDAAWAAFQAEGRSATLRDWLALSSLPKEEQRRELSTTRCRGRPAALRSGAGRARPARELEAALRRLPADDPRAQTLRWVLDAGPFPEK